MEKKKLVLEKVIESIEMAMDTVHYFYDIETNDLVSVIEYSGLKEDEEILEMIDMYPNRFLAMPEKREFNEYSVMEDFIDAFPECRLKEELYQCIKGKGAFRRFKDEVNYTGIAEWWYKFRDDAIVNFAKKWCEDRGYEYK